MKKKAMFLLLLVPFVIGILAFTTSNFVIRNVEQDVQDISREYELNTPFKLSEGRKLLKAEPIFDETYPLAEGNTLIWESENNNVAEIDIDEENNYYLNPKKEGRTKISCFNKKKSIIKSFVAIVVGDSGAIIVNPIIPFSAKKITDIDYVGLYDKITSYDTKTIDANLKLDIQVVGGSLKESEIETYCSKNISFDKASDTVKFLSTGPAKINFKNPYSEVGDFELSFEIVNAVNVYDYDGLLNTTNRSESGYPIVLRRNLESLKNSYEVDEKGKPLKLKSKDTELFGKLDDDGSLMSFENDVYRFETTYNHDFLNARNKAIDDGTLENHEKTTTDCLAGIRIQKDIYGNGFTINTHELVYPSLEKEITTPNGVIKISSLSKDDLFRGPLLFMSLGDPNFSINEINPIFSLYGQDNSSFYLNGDDITLNDVHFKGSDFGTNLTNLQFSGSVIDVLGDNNTIKNSIIENGRNVVRSYSSNNLLIQNTLLKNGMEFLFRSGANEYNYVDLNKRVYYKVNGQEAVTTAENYLKPYSYLEEQHNEQYYAKNYKADGILTYGIMHNTQIADFAGIEMLDYSEEELIEGTNKIKEVLTNNAGIIDKNNIKNYKGNAVLDNVFFNNSGISSISMDCYPQGSFIQNSITSLFKLIIGMYLDKFPENLALTSYPTKVEIKNDSRFYDWKDLDLLSFESLIQQDIFTLIAIHGGVGTNFEITEDDFLPIKKILLSKQENSLVKNNKINLPIYFQGGGYNVSDVVMDDELEVLFNELCVINPYEYSLKLKQEFVPDFNASAIAKLEAMRIAMLRATSNVTGFNEYKIQGLLNNSAKWFNENPNINELKTIKNVNNNFLKDC